MTIRTNTPNLLDNPPSDLSEGVTTLRTQTAELTALEDRQVPVQAKLAAAWTSLMFLVIYIDYFHLYQPGEIDDIRGGVIFELDISGTLMSIFFAIIAIPALMILLSMTLPARVNRATNLVVASLYIPAVGMNFLGSLPDYAFYYALTIGVEVLLLAFILRAAWTWPRTPSPSMPDLVEPNRSQIQMGSLSQPSV
ncbi:MAG: DUF6326 family protein [Chloroflexota bacterium]|nr:DUF6326 family protein [Chloroflexota bacterium]